MSETLVLRDTPFEAPGQTLVSGRDSFLKATAAKRKSPPANPAMPNHPNPTADADVWMHARPGSEMLNRKVDAEAVDVWMYCQNGLPNA